MACPVANRIQSGSSEFNRRLGWFPRQSPMGSKTVQTPQGEIQQLGTGEPLAEIELLRQHADPPLVALQIGDFRFGDATRILIGADPRSARSRIPHSSLDDPRGLALATETGPEQSPYATTRSSPGTSKWNKIEHRMFSFITLNWRGRPLTSIRTIVSWILLGSRNIRRIGRRGHQSRRLTTTCIRVGTSKVRQGPSDTELAGIPAHQLPAPGSRRPARLHHGHRQVKLTNQIRSGP